MGFNACAWYSGRIDPRLVLTLEIKRATQWGLCERLGLSVRAIQYKVRAANLAGLVRIWYCGLMPCYSLTNEGKQYAAQLRATLTASELEKLLIPRNKRAPNKPNKPNSLGNSLGL